MNRIGLAPGFWIGFSADGRPVCAYGKSANEALDLVDEWLTRNPSHTAVAKVDRWFHEKAKEVANSDLREQHALRDKQLHVSDREEFIQSTAASLYKKSKLPKRGLEAYKLFAARYYDTHIAPQSKQER